MLCVADRYEYWHITDTDPNNKFLLFFRFVFNHACKRYAVRRKRVCTSACVGVAHTCAYVNGSCIHVAFPHVPTHQRKLVTATPLVPNHLSRQRELRVLKISPRHGTSVSCMFIFEARDRKTNSFRWDSGGSPRLKPMCPL